MNLNNFKKFHIVGIGGIGTSAIANLLIELNKNVVGTDIYDSVITKSLVKKGIKIIYGKHQSKNLKSDIDLLIYSNAIKINNAELLKAKKLNIDIYSYPQFLALLMKNSIQLVVTGTHGKSTTTAMLAKIFFEAKLDPSVIIGTIFPEIGNNAHLGFSKYFIVEGDEYQKAFLNYDPIGLIINNIEEDHLDYYKNIRNIKNAFGKVVSRVPKGGIIVINADDKNINEIIKYSKSKVISFGINNGDYQATHIIHHGELTRFAVKGLEKFDLAIKIPGIHNVRNALAATVLSISFGIKIEIIKKALLEFSGILRRFEIKKVKNGITVIDDYAHHPTEIKATLRTARKYFKGRRIWCIYQPHSGPRTKALFNNFTKAFFNCDKLILTDIYQVPGREKAVKFDIRKLYKEIKVLKKDTVLIKNFKLIPKKIKKEIKSGDVIITMGAGTITEISGLI